MSSWRSPAVPSETTTTGPRAKCDQVIFEAISKAAEIVVLNRCEISPKERSQQRSSGRFNLQTPEISSVRKVLGPFKRSLHVPLRLDVYYQHDANRRELLERWLIEYAPCHSSFFTQECSSQDPLVQLRHVCKKLVIWNRCLYCLAQLLPCSAKSNRVGFSIYVSDQDRQQDVEELTVNSGFVLQQHSSVYTPYGRLDMECLYAPKDAIRKLFPKQPTARWVHPSAIPPSNSSNTPVSSTGTAAQPIPTPNSNSTTTHPNNKIQPQNAAQSAPSHLAIIPNYTSSPSNTPLQHQFHSPQLQSQQQQQQLQQQQQQQQPLGTTAPTNMMMNYKRSESYKTDTPQKERVFLRSKSNLSDDPRRIHHTQHPHTPQTTTPTMPNSSQNQKRVLSGLSLAMMNADESPNSTTHDADETEEEPFNTASSPPSPRYEQRRAALHRPPPQLSTSPKMPTPPLGPVVKHPGEYGYAYNNHIPWGQLPGQQQSQTASGTTTMTQPMRISPLQGGGETTTPPVKYTTALNNNMSTSPGSTTPVLGSTPPQPMFMAGSTSNNNTPSSFKATTAAGIHQHLLPPMSSRNNSSHSKRSSPEMTPPFAAVPTTLSMPPPAASAIGMSSVVQQQQSMEFQQQQQQQQHSAGGLPLAPQLASTAEEGVPHHDDNNNNAAAVPPPISSLDLLQSSPFHLPQSNTATTNNNTTADGSSKLSSLSGGGAGSYMSSRIFAAAAAAQYSSTTTTGAMSSALWATAGGGATGGGLLSSGTGAAIIPDHDNVLGGEEEDDMPFAVDPTPLMGTSSTASNMGGGNGGSDGTSTTNNNSNNSLHLDASTASAAVMARKCATATRLKLFDSQQILVGEPDTTNATTTTTTGAFPNNNNVTTTTTAPREDVMVASLADQLAEFRTFGASLHVSTADVLGGGSGGGGGGVGGSSEQGSTATPPIALKT